MDALKCEIIVKQDKLDKLIEHQEELNEKYEDAKVDLDEMTERFKDAHKEKMNLKGEVEYQSKELQKRDFQITSQSAIFKDVSERYAKLKEAYA